MPIPHYSLDRDLNGKQFKDRNCRFLILPFLSALLSIWKRKTFCHHFSLRIVVNIILTHNSLIIK